MFFFSQREGKCCFFLPFQTPRDFCFFLPFQTPRDFLLRAQHECAGQERLR